MKPYLLILLALLAGCSSTQKSQPNPQAVTNQAPSYANKVYYFQHKLLPEWTYNSNGLFYADLLSGDLTGLKQAATEIISPDYADELSTRVINDGEAVLITFPAPKSFTHCFYVLIKRQQNGYNFYTYEKTMNFGDGDNAAGVVGSWSEEGAHGNLGGRTYTSAADFVSDILNHKG